MDDADEFLAATENATTHHNSGEKTASKHYGDEPKSDRKEKPSPGRVSQYVLYGPGFKPATPTVPTLPPGCYDLAADNQGTYCIPVPEPTGLLLELPEMRSEEVIKIVENFWASEKDYKEGNRFVRGGANFKAGIMIFGEPGTGKSCTIKIVSRKLVHRGGTVFYAGVNPGIVNSFLGDFRTVEPDRKCIVILEDIDSLIGYYGEAAYLEMLDSAKTIDNVMFIATTNYPDRLDARIYNRPGRFSQVVKIGLPGEAARRAFLEAILLDYSDVDAIVAGSEGYSIDHLSALINAVYREKKDLQKEMARLRKLFKMPKLDADKKVGF